MGPVFTKPPAVMGRCCASSWTGWGEVLGNVICAETSAGNPVASSPRRVVARRASNMAVSIRGVRENEYRPKGGEGIQKLAMFGVWNSLKDLAVKMQVLRLPSLRYGRSK